jgi:hypothetical protein
VAERFFNTLKTEFISQQTYATRAQAKSAIFEIPNPVINAKASQFNHYFA